MSLIIGDDDWRLWLGGADEGGSSLIEPAAP